MRVIDLHCDTVMKLMEGKEKVNLRRNDFSVDLERLQKSNSMAQFFALFIEKEYVENPFEFCMDMADRIHAEIKSNSEIIKLATNYEELIRNNEEGKISAFLTIEEGGALKGKLSNLRNFHKLGVRLITLTWNYENEIGYPNKNSNFINNGLKAFGLEVVEEMNNLGMIIDVSHLSDGGFYDVAKYSKYPFVASHSNAREVCAHRRNLTDDMIKILSNKGGITGINFERSFLNNDGRSNIEDMIKHINHIYNVGGIEVIALGTDLDGINSKGIEIDNIGDIHKLSHALVKDGFSEDEVEKIFYKNAMRLIKDVMR
ncbi:dipeptidase [Clostridium sp. UBA4548]|uniref:dipeptidase n=1 Tax=Clostridium sp. UBA4548 TaxID=1946361 RepID=UPI0025C22AED|nr:dipeptidase [Clostridium sp. UBA4548]